MKDMLVWFVYVVFLLVYGEGVLATRPNLEGGVGKGYRLAVGIGTPAQWMLVLVDTGSSNFAVAVAPVESVTPYFHSHRSSSFESLNITVSSNYAVGHWSGTLASELISSPWIPGRPIRVEMTGITESDKFFKHRPMQGILGLAYKAIAKPGGSVTPVFDDLVSEGRVSNIFSMQLCGTVKNGTHTDTNTTGTMVFNGTDPSLYVPPIVYTPLAREWYYEVIITRMTVGNEEVALPCSEYNNDSTIVDSGTSSLRLPVNVYSKVLSLINNHMNGDLSVDDSFLAGDSLMCCNSPSFSSFPTLSISLLSDETDEEELTLLVLPHMYLQAYPDPEKKQRDCYQFSILPSTSGTVLGTVVMEGYYVVFDRIHSRVGFATSTCQIQNEIFAKPSVARPERRRITADCRYRQRPQNLQGAPGKGYSLQLDIGTPPQQMFVLLDTGSSNFAVAAAPVESVKHYFRPGNSTSYQSLDRTVSVDYTVGHWSGTLAKERISSPSIPGGPIKVEMTGITESDKFFKHLPMEGILGLAYKAIAKPGGSVTPVFDYLVSEGRVSNIFSMQLCGTVDKGTHLDVSTGGTMVFNGTDSSLYVPPIVYTPLAKEWYYDVIITRMTVGHNEVALPCTEFNNDKTIVDSGTTGLRLPGKVYNAVVSLVKNYVRNSASTDVNDKFWTGGLLCWPTSNPDFSGFPTVSISLLSDESEDKEFTLLVLPQMYLQAYPDPETRQRDCYKFSILSSTSGTVLGAVVMEGYYVVFDRINSRVGFAQSTCQIRDSNFAKPLVSRPESRQTSTDCRHKKDSGLSSVILITLAVSGCIIVISLIIIVAVSCLWCRKKRGSDGLYTELRDKAVNDDDE